MSILVTGINHKTAPVELRETLAIDSGRIADATHSLLQIPGVDEAMILSTCNRVELVVSHQGSKPDLLGFLGNHLGVDTTLLRPHVYEHRDIDAAQHLFRVSSSLDSMIVGEPQILGQVKEAYAAARSTGAIRSHLEKLMQASFSVAKKVRSETLIGSSSVSIASVAVDLAKKIFGSLEGKTVLLVGAGKMSELAAQQLIKQGTKSILIANRTHERAIRMASAFNGQAVCFEDLYTMGHKADIVITSTGSQQHIFQRAHGQEFMRRRRNRPMFFIDIAVPRDVDPDMNGVEGVFLYDIDGLQTQAASHLADRTVEAQRAELIVAKEAIRFQRHEMAVNVTPMIVGLQTAAEDMRQAELSRSQNRLRSLSSEQYAAVEALTKSLMNKFLHQPMRTIKGAGEQSDAVMLDVLRTTFNLHAAQDQQATAMPAGKANSDNQNTQNSVAVTSRI
jgi:glutamyl-tRNA reductase